MDDVVIRVFDLPHAVKGITVKDANDDFNIYINARCSLYEQEKARKHELRHCNEDDFYKAFLHECETYTDDINKLAQK